MSKPNSLTGSSQRTSGECYFGLVTVVNRKWADICFYVPGNEFLPPTVFLSGPTWSQITTTLSPFDSSFCVLRQGLCGSLCSQSWPHTYGTPPASAPQVVTLQAHITMPSPRLPLQWLLWLFLTLHPTCDSLRAWQLPASVTPSEALPCAPSLESQRGSR